MPATTPEAVNEQLIKAIEEGDIDTALSLYEADAQFVTAEGTVSGLGPIREVLEGFMAVKPKFDLTPKPTVQCGDIALTGNNWSLTGVGPDGSALAMSGSSYEVVRCDSNGHWRFAIDNPDA